MCNGNNDCRDDSDEQGCGELAHMYRACTHANTHTKHTHTHTHMYRAHIHTHTHWVLRSEGLVVF